jgi:hypothetical protein
MIHLAMQIDEQFCSSGPDIRVQLSITVEGTAGFTVGKRMWFTSET